MEPLIKVRDLTKDYKLTRKREGVAGGLVVGTPHHGEPGTVFTGGCLPGNRLGEPEFGVQGFQVPDFGECG